MARTFLSNFPELVNSLSNLTINATPTPADFADGLHLPVMRFPCDFGIEETEDDLVRERKLWKRLNLAKGRILWVNYSEAVAVGQFRLLWDWIQENSCILLFEVNQHEFFPSGLHFFLKPLDKTF